MVLTPCFSSYLSFPFSLSSLLPFFFFFWKSLLWVLVFILVSSSETNVERSCSNCPRPSIVLELEAPSPCLPFTIRVSRQQAVKRLRSVNIGKRISFDIVLAFSSMNTARRPVLFANLIPKRFPHSKPPSPCTIGRTLENCVPSRIVFCSVVCVQGIRRGGCASPGQTPAY